MGNYGWINHKTHVKEVLRACKKRALLRFKMKVQVRKKGYIKHKMKQKSLNFFAPKIYQSAQGLREPKFGPDKKVTVVIFL